MLKTLLTVIVYFLISTKGYCQDQLIPSGFNGPMIINGTVRVASNAKVTFTSLQVISGSLILLPGAQVLVPEGDFVSSIFNAALTLKSGSVMEFSRNSAVFNGVDSIEAGALLSADNITFSRAGNFNEGKITAFVVTVDSTMMLQPCSTLICEELVNKYPNAISGSGFIAIGGPQAVDSYISSFPLTTSSGILVSYYGSSTEFGSAVVSPTTKNPCASLTDSVVYFLSSTANGIVKFTWETELEINVNHFEIIQVVDTGLKVIASVPTSAEDGYSSSSIIYNYQEPATQLMLSGFNILVLLLVMGSLYACVRNFRFKYALSLAAAVLMFVFMSCNKTKLSTATAGTYKLRVVHNDHSVNYASTTVASY